MNCERCSTPIDLPEFASVILSFHEGPKRYALCSICRDDLRNWIRCTFYKVVDTREVEITYPMDE
jgi:hypothetical protein